MKKFIIIGGGISSLSLAWYLKKKFGKEVFIKILEKTNRTGGWINTVTQNGFLFEKGPRSFRTSGSGLNTIELIEELDLESEVIVASKDAKKRFIYLNGKLEPLPNSLFSFLKSRLTKGVIPALLRDLWRPQPNHTNVDETIAEFCARRFSSNLGNRLIDPVISGIYAGDINQLSLKACFPDLYTWDQKNISLLRTLATSSITRKQNTLEPKSDFIKNLSKESIFSFKNGVGTLIDRLTQLLKDEIQTCCEVTSLKMSENLVTVHLSDGQTLSADHVFLSTHFDEAFPLLKDVGVTVSKPALEASSVAVVNLGWKKNVLKQRGFGYLIPYQERNSSVLGVVFDSLTFPEQNKNSEETRLTVMLGGTCHQEMATMTSTQIENLAISTIKEHLNIAYPPDEIHLSIAKRAIPQYLPGYNKMVADLKTELSQKTSGRLTLLGSSWNGVSLNDCIIAAKLIAKEASP